MLFLFTLNVMHSLKMIHNRKLWDEKVCWVQQSTCMFFTISKNLILLWYVQNKHFNEKIHLIIRLLCRISSQHVRHYGNQQSQPCFDAWKMPLSCFWWRRLCHWNENAPIWLNSRQVSNPNSSTSIKSRDEFALHL